MIHKFKSKTGFTILSKENQKTIVGGKIKVICICKGSPLMETVVCSSNSFSGTVNCISAATDYCNNHGFSGVDCSVTGSIS